MPPPSDDRNAGVWLRPRDQLSLGVLTASALLLMAAYWLSQGGHRGELIDIDRAPPLTAEFQVDVNRAQWPELMQLPGIGPTLAQRLVDHHQRHGEFQEIDELTQVRGIGQRTLQRIRPYLQPIPSNAAWAAR